MWAGEEIVLHSPNSSSSSSDVNSTLFDSNTLTSEMCSFRAINGTNSIWNLLVDYSCFRHSAKLTVFLCLVYFLIFACGLVGNSLVIFAVLWKPRMRTVTNMFIMNLAVADLFVIIFCVPATLLANIFIPWILGDFMCSAVAYVQGVSIFSSVYSLVAVSVDRCRAIYRPMDIPRGLSKPQTFFFIAIIWLAAVVVTLPWWYVFQIVYSAETGQLPYCHENWSNIAHGQAYFFFVHLLMCYCLPLNLIIIFNTIIWRSVSSRRIPQNHSSTSASTTVLHIDQMHRTTKLRVLKMLTCLTLAFFLSWLPLYIVMTRLKFFGLPAHNTWEMDLIEIIIPLAQLLGSSNSCMNPILYAFLNKKFRETVKSFFSSSYCGCGHRPSSFSWRRRTCDGTNHVSMPQTLNTVTLDRTTFTMTLRSSGQWSRSPSLCRNNMEMRNLSSPNQHLAQSSTLRSHGSSASHSNTSECACTNF